MTRHCEGSREQLPCSETLQLNKYSVTLQPFHAASSSSFYWFGNGSISPWGINNGQTVQWELSDGCERTGGRLRWTMRGRERDRLQRLSASLYFHTEAFVPTKHSLLRCCWTVSASMNMLDSSASNCNNVMGASWCGMFGTNTDADIWEQENYNIQYISW